MKEITEIFKNDGEFLHHWIETLEEKMGGSVERAKEWVEKDPIGATRWAFVGGFLTGVVGIGSVGALLVLAQKFLDLKNTPETQEAPELKH